MATGASPPGQRARSKPPAGSAWGAAAETRKRLRPSATSCTSSQPWSNASGTVSPGWCRRKARRRRAASSASVSRADQRGAAGEPRRRLGVRQRVQHEWSRRAIIGASTRAKMASASALTEGSLDQVRVGQRLAGKDRIEGIELGLAVARHHPRPKLGRHRAGAGNLLGQGRLRSRRAEKRTHRASLSAALLRRGRGLVGGREHGT